MSQVITAPSEDEPRFPTIFLAGSIDMGQAANWQQEIMRVCEPYDVTIYNPRRTDWDSSWTQSLDNDQFVEQVEWELDNLNGVNLAIFYFDPSGPAPITLMEVGAFAVPDCSVICCPDGYWRKGNVEVFARWMGVPSVESLDDLKLYVEQWIVENCKL